MRGRTLKIASVVLVAGFAAFVAWVSGRGRADQRRGSTAAGATPTEDAAAGLIPSAPQRDGGLGGPAPIDEPILDRRVRDDVRRRILQAWAESPDEEVAAAARDGRFVPIPEDRDASNAYLRETLRRDFVPLARSCYDQLVAREAGAGGALLLKFQIVGDEHVGGVVDDVTVELDGGWGDPELVTCLRESFLSLSFRPPPGKFLAVATPLTFVPGAGHHGGR